MLLKIDPKNRKISSKKKPTISPPPKLKQESIMKSWKSEYLRILFSPKIDEEDFNLAKELLDEGYASGSYLPDNSGSGKSVYSLNWKGINSKGRIFADELQLQIKKESLSYKVTQFCLWLGGIFVGYLIKSMAC